MPTVVMTGGTSGLGEVAAGRIAASGATLLLGARSAGANGLDVLPLDLARLDSVRSFAEAVGDRLGDTPVDVLVLNAGLSFHSVDQRTPDGLETTFAVNHLSQYLLLRLLLPRLAHGARVIITSSSTHDPELAGILPAPRHADAKLLAHPELDPDLDESPRKAGGHAYTSSKLCNVLTARALAAQPLAAERALSVIAYDPGATPGTGLSRNFSPAIRLVWALLGSPLGRLVPRYSSRAQAGGTLADLALGIVRPPADQGYASLVKGRLTWPRPSALARDPRAADALWHDSAALAGLT
ncbi:SDR family NAD(P)-dependent oxidoreductase [Streptomyces sp. 8K308]|uniref:SDR family NAD(P)-dependent oxidoreductase n=1 Tax=Streptomyces sp. 8K308 TaxID=2530388 RepID=UPI00104E3888|nr:SDR family NAD(P)-dependent oxidoreductase [Streptomyces sp. 8K308]TDC20152.1 SDR family NAD(P)-dependent oxidoreductase [Streptomyces sp. 8K308]